ncbi:Ig-like domain-containing protein [Nitrosarchaeum sp.]|uniref:Ig-like domain-containing protein n=1 Tax=Nitrosarchaeum sp. TaxID=2026886 RepID=UPI00247C2455|nr:Ig-like domain-containing protein [Nitrosarchaeum sp.]MCV0411937.1 tandem-95 repeat protein [Nitrosarchaeum sp.]
MQKLLGLFLFAVLISGAFSSSFAFAQIPTAQNDQYSLNEDSILTVDSNGVLINDANIDNDFFAIIQTSVGFGILTLNLNGTFTYTPNSNFNSVDSFTYVATNGTHSSNNATVTLFVNPVNDAPIAQNNTATTPENTSVIISVLNNDSDVDGDSLTISSVTQGANGTVTTNSTIVTYIPKPNFHGVDSFRYTISDGLLTDIATVSVTVTPFDDPDDDNDDKVNICHKDKKTISVSVNAISAHLKHGDTVGACENDQNQNINKKLIEEQITTLKKDFKAQEKILKEQLKALEKKFKAQEKELKEQLKDLKKDKKSKDHDDDHDDDD